MALVSPGISISINDQSQYVNSAVGSVPLVILATAQDKTYNGSPATGTSAAAAGTLLSFTSQRDLVTQMGAPTFQTSSIGSPVNGGELNEYGLMTAYSALGLSNQLYAIRANIDLDQLSGTSVRPIGAPANGTYWENLTTTEWGINSLDAVNSVFDAVDPLMITSNTQVSGQSIGGLTNVPVPIASIGTIGQYALVFVNVDGSIATTVSLYYKNYNNAWVQVGTTAWQQSLPAATATVLSPTFTTGYITVNSANVHVATATKSGLITAINNAAITGVTAATNAAGYVEVFVTSAATSNGSTVDGKLILNDNGAGILASLGLNGITAYAPILFYGNYAQTPNVNGQVGWFSTDPAPRPSGSIWWKLGALGSGFVPGLSQYNSASDSFTNLTVPVYSAQGSAIYGLDPVGGGANIPANQVIATYTLSEGYSNGIQFFKATGNGSSGTGATPDSSITGSLTIQASVPGSNILNSTSLTFSGASPLSIVTNILQANIPYVTASLTSSGAINITHTLGGLITLYGTALGTSSTSGTRGMGFYAAGNGYWVSPITATAIISGFVSITGNIAYSSYTPYSAPSSGTFWYWSDPTQIDIMVNTGYSWQGYRTVSGDTRGFNLQNTDPNGVIVTPTTAPTSQSTGAALVSGDLWLDSGDLENFPALYRYNGNSKSWTAIDTDDQITSNGILFADARWDASLNGSNQSVGGLIDPVSGNFPSIATMLTSSYVDLDAPNAQLYPRGMLLFNTRRSGYNVKKFVQNYFNASSFPNSTLPVETSAWVSASGLASNGTMLAGPAAQRSMVVGAMQAAVDSNTDILSAIYNFNLIVAPGYPELIPNMLTLNDNRGDTAFVIGDTPMDLAPNVTDITNWVNNTSGDGLPSDAAASPYLALYYPAGQTNDLSGNQIVVPASHAVLRTFLYNDQVAYPWFAPAGVNRGLVSNLSSIGYINASTGSYVRNAIDQGLRDALFTLQVNPITQLPSTGLVVFGQLTRAGSSSSQNRVNVVRLENYLRTIFTSISNGYLFEPNDAITRKSIATQIENSLNNVLALRGVYDFLVICDTSNNTPATIANNQLYVDVAIEPMKDVEFIYIPIAIYNPGEIAQLNTQSS